MKEPDANAIDHENILYEFLRQSHRRGILNTYVEKYVRDLFLYKRPDKRSSDLFILIVP